MSYAASPSMACACDASTDRPYVLDFYVPAAKLAIEVDGAAHDVAAQAVRDRVRDGWLASRGIRTLRFTAPDILDPGRRADALATIAARTRERVRE